MMSVTLLPALPSPSFQVTATYLARLGVRVDLSDSVPAAALALRQARKVPGG